MSSSKWIKEAKFPESRVTEAFSSFPNLIHRLLLFISHSVVELELVPVYLAQREYPTMGSAVSRSTLCPAGAAFFHTFDGRTRHFYCFD
jgi:hypothetical protein